MKLVTTIRCQGLLLVVSVFFVIAFFPSSARAETSSTTLLADLKETATILQEFQGLLASFEKIRPTIEKGASSTSDLPTYTSQLQEGLNILIRMLELQQRVNALNSRFKSSLSSSQQQTTASDNNSRENLTISAIEIDKNVMDCGARACDQLIKVLVKNDQYGSKNLSGKKAKYSVRVYELYNGRSRTDILSTGEFLVPYANGYSEFEVSVEGGLGFDGKNFEKTYQARVDIDTDTDVSESNEKDNTGWSDNWVMQYYKG